VSLGAGTWEIGLGLCGACGRYYFVYCQIDVCDVSQGYDGTVFVVVIETGISNILFRKL